MDAMQSPSPAGLREIVDRRGLCVTVYTPTGSRVDIDDAVHEVNRDSPLPGVQHRVSPHHAPVRGPA